MSIDIVKLVDPTGEQAEAAISRLAPRLESLRGLRIALIDNAKHHASTFLNATRRLLQKRYEVAEIEYCRKFSAALPLPAAEIQRLAASCDAIIHGVAD